MGLVIAFQIRKLPWKRRERFFSRMGFTEWRLELVAVRRCPAAKELALDLPRQHFGQKRRNGVADHTLHIAPASIERYIVWKCLKSTELPAR